VASGRLIANPVAGSDEAEERLAHIEQRLQSRYRFDTVLTRGPGDARRAAAESAARGDTLVFVAGGDGTLNEALNGLAQVEDALARVTLGVIPLGTGNDFAAALALPDDIDAVLEVLLRGRVRPVDIGEVNGRLFVNASGGGFLADVSESVDPALKSVAGRLAYLLGGAKVLLQTEPFGVRIDASGTPRERLDCLLFAVCNAPMVGGGRPIAPDAVIDDGQLDVCVVRAMDLIAFVGLLTRVGSGTHVLDPRVEYFQAERISLAFDRTVAVNADGEVFPANRCDYIVHAGGARFLA
jgi:diacylglycerol kinase (ATP)